jgi:hypothetical protein
MCIRSLLAVSSALMLSLPCPAAAPEWVWAVSAGGKLNDKTRAVNVDREGNVYLAGEATEEVDFGGTKVQGHGKALDFFVAKVSPEGKFLWARMEGGDLTDRGYGVAPDAAGNVYVTGHYESTNATFGGQAVPNRGGYDIFVAKYDRDGKLQWVQTAGGKGYDYGHGIAVDPKGDVVVTGAVVGEAEFGDVKLPSTWAGGRVFCAKYHADGKLVWAKASTGAAGGSGHGVAVDGAGNIYVGGMASGRGEFGGKELVTPKGSSALVAKLSPAGEVLWVAQHFGEASCLFHEITADEQGRVWASGMWKGQATFGGETFTTTNEKDADALVSHFDTDGKLLWTRVGQGPGVDYGLGVATDGTGAAYLTGEFSEGFKLAGTELKNRGGTDIYVAKFDEKGALVWTTTAGGEKGENAYTMVCDRAGNLVLAGSFVGTTRFGEKEMTSVGSGDLYVAKLRGR